RESFLRPSARDVRGAGRGARQDSPALRQAAAPVHARTTGSVPIDLGTEDAARRHSRLAARSRPSARGLPLRPALSLCDGEILRREAAALPSRRRARALLPLRERRRARGSAGGDRRGRVTEPLLRTEGLTRHFSVGPLLSRQRLHAVDDVNLTIDAGEIVALVGESGSGK